MSDVVDILVLITLSELVLILTWVVVNNGVGIFMYLAQPEPAKWTTSPREIGDGNLKEHSTWKTNMISPPRLSWRKQREPPAKRA